MATDSKEFLICNYPNDHQTAVTLMIDDLAPTAITYDGKLAPAHDHGYAMAQSGGLYHYFQEHLLKPFPEVRGTFFILIDQHTNHRAGTGGYTILSQGFSDAYVQFLKSTAPQFDLAFHGTSHGKIENGRFHQEFSYLTTQDVPRLKAALEAFERKTGITFQGGKFPGYISNEYSKKILEELGMKWWAFDKSMKNSRGHGNAFSYFGDEQKVLNLPTTFAGEAFKTFLRKKPRSFQSLRSAYQAYRKVKLENHLQYLYENRLVISIQEHFSTFRSDGTFQRPNVHDDILSLQKIYATLRGADLWHATCNEVARYVENRDHTALEHTKNTISLTYTGRYKQAILSLKSNLRHTLTNDQGEKISPFYKGGHWVYPEVKAGSYIID